MTILSRDKILAAADIETQEMEIPEWGGTIVVREMTMAEVDEFGLSSAQADGRLDTRKMRGIRARVVSWCVVDEEGKPLFRKSDVDELLKKSNRVVDRIFDAILALSGMSPDEEGVDNSPKEE
jgi:hypothetical protein